MDSDFDIDEGEEPTSDHEEDEPKKKRRVVTKAYKVRGGARGRSRPAERFIYFIDAVVPSAGAHQASEAETQAEAGGGTEQRAQEPPGEAAPPGDHRGRRGQ